METFIAIWVSFIVISACNRYIKHLNEQAQEELKQQQIEQLQLNDPAYKQFVIDMQVLDERLHQSYCQVYSNHLDILLWEFDYYPGRLPEYSCYLQIFRSRQTVQNSLNAIRAERTAYSSRLQRGKQLIVDFRERWKLDTIDNSKMLY